MKTKFENLTKDELWMLRLEICINSVLGHDYANSFGYSTKSVGTFFNGYYEFLWELAEENNDENEITHRFVIENYDNKENLWEWFNCYDDFSWVEYED